RYLSLAVLRQQSDRLARPGPVAWPANLNSRDHCGVPHPGLESFRRVRRAVLLDEPKEHTDEHHGLDDRSGLQLVHQEGNRPEYAEQSNERVLERPEDLDMPPWGPLVDHLVEPELALPATDLVRRQAVQGRAQRLEERRDSALSRGMEVPYLARRLACEPSGPAR